MKLCRWWKDGCQQYSSKIPCPTNEICPAVEKYGGAFGLHGSYYASKTRGDV